MRENYRVAGEELDQYIESELLAMEREGLEKSPIKASTLHVRLKAKGLISGGLSTLSTNKRKELIAKYKKRQHNLSQLKEDELEMIEGRRINSAYISKAKRLEAERNEIKKMYELNLFALLDIVKCVQATTPIKVEDLLSHHLIRELRK